MNRSSHLLPAVMGALLEARADANAIDNAGWTALMWAAGKGRDVAVYMLIEAGAVVDVRNSDGRSALHLAAYEGAIRLAGWVAVLMIFADTCFWLATFPPPPTSFISIRVPLSLPGHRPCLRLLLRSGASPIALDNDGKTPIDWARTGWSFLSGMRCEPSRPQKIPPPHFYPFFTPFSPHTHI